MRMTAALHPYDHLFSQISVNRLSLKNRLVMGPMGNTAMVDAAGCPSSKMIAYFEARARGGAGLLISGLVPVSPKSDPAIDQPGSFACFPRMDGTRGVMAGWRDLAESIHARGARFFIQLTAGLGRVGSPECLPTRWRLPVSASWNPNFYIPQILCRSDRRLGSDGRREAGAETGCSRTAVQLPILRPGAIRWRPFPALPPAGGVNARLASATASGAPRL